MFKKISAFILILFIAIVSFAQDSSHNTHTNAPLIFSVDTSQQIIKGRTNSAAQMNKPYVILISADGFRADFNELYNAKNLN